MTHAPRAARIALDALPIVDISGWRSSDPAARSHAAANVLAGCRDVGFLYVRGHGIPEVTLQLAIAAAKAFFAQPESIKHAIHYSKAGMRRGYLPMLVESSDPSAIGDLKEAFDCGFDPPGRSHAVNADGITISNQWPENPSGFRAAVEAYLEAAMRLARDMFAMIGHSLGLEDDYFARRIDAPIATLRLLRYPPQTPPTSTEILGIGEHCDYECFTILAQDEIGGLQVRGLDGAWIEAPPVPGTLVVNVGEMLSRWTNDMLIPTSHRVVNAAGRERYSIPVFFATNPEVIIEPLAVCTSAESPARYAPIPAGDYLSARLTEIYGTPL